MCMATMASTSHGLSAFANMCVKSPINPKTGSSATLHDRKNMLIKYDDVVAEYEYEEGVPETVEFDNGDLSNEHATSNFNCEKLLTSNGDKFYENLQQLKEENRKTLEAFEKLYQDKLLVEGLRASNFYEVEHDKSGVDREVPADSVGLSIRGVSNQTRSRVDKSVVGKPPPGKSRELPKHTPVLSKKLPKKSAHGLQWGRPSSAPIERRSNSLDTQQWNESFFQTRESGENFIIPTEDNSSEYEKALAKVDRLWEDFKISEHIQRRHSFSSSDRKNRDKSEDAKLKTSEWRHRITIPQPFKMSTREAFKEMKKTSAQEEVEKKRLEKQQQEEAECEKKFKAQPVPSHVYLPLYEEIMERNETRRRYIKQYCRELLESQVKPFNFEIREQEKKFQRAHSVPVRRPERVNKGFKARPVPKHIFSPEIDEKILEEEELRKIRIKMRSRELIHESSLPPSMAEREKLKEQERKEKARLAKLKIKKSRPRNAHDIPNYDALYNEFKKELARRRAIREGTVTEPFHLMTKHIPSNKDKIRKDIIDDEKRLKENRWPFLGSRTTPRSSIKYLDALSSSMDYIPSQATRSTELRSSMIKKEKERLAHRLIEEEEAEKRRKARDAKLRHYLSEKTNSAEIPNPRDSIAEKLKRIRQEDRKRQDAYHREIEDMNVRVQQSPLLVEKYMSENAKRAAEKKFTATLQKAGLDERDFISTKKSGLSATGENDAIVDYSADNYEDDTKGADRTSDPLGNGDLTYTKSETPEIMQDEEA